MLNFEEACDVILIDFTRAFDKVSHSVLMVTLSSLRIRGKLLSWLNNFLTNRTQYVTYKGIASVAKAITSGVVQGSALGSQLFAAMINDLPLQTASVHMLHYADDSKAEGKLATSLQDCQNILADLDAVYQLSVVNLLPLNVPKCQCLHLAEAIGDIHTNLANRKY